MGGHQWLGRRSPMGQVGRPDDIAHAALYLASEDARTGAEIVVDGGHTAQ